MAEIAASNPLLDITSSPETSPQIALHPLVILTISDYVTRRTLRKLSGPIVGAIVGQQNGREITMEVAFECKSTIVGGEVHLDARWFEERLDQYRTVFKDPQLDLVGWFTLGSPNGPEPRHLPIHVQIQEEYNLENAIMLLFHPEEVAGSSKMGGKLPLTLYEGIVSNEDLSGNAMDVDGAVERGKSLKFRELTYAVETGEAEMISLDFVARGGGNATAVQSTEKAPDLATAVREFVKGKAKAIDTDETESGADRSYLSVDDEELITSLTAKANAIKMLRSRLNLLQSFLASLPPSYLTDASISLGSDAQSQTNHQILRSINALLARLPLVTPPDVTAFTRESQQSKSDVELISLLASLTRTVNEAKELGRKWTVAEINRAQTSGAQKRGFEYRSGFGAGMRNMPEGFGETVGDLEDGFAY